MMCQAAVRKRRQILLIVTIVGMIIALGVLLLIDIAWLLHNTQEKLSSDAQQDRTRTFAWIAAVFLVLAEGALLYHVGHLLTRRA